uniref:Centromere protein S n=1 Tax=Oreochromis aureus TaxID=47969 RepID=A0AAZ1XRP1_OREAU
MVCHKIFVSKHSVEEKPGDGLLEEEGWTERHHWKHVSVRMDKEKATTCKTISFLGASCFTSSEPILTFICIKEDIFAKDLEAFARHAKRSTVSVDDVKLVARRSTALSIYIQNKSDELTQEHMSLKKKTTAKRKNIETEEESRE